MYFVYPPYLCRIQISATFSTLKMINRNKTNLEATRGLLQIHCWVSNGNDPVKPSGAVQRTSHMIHLYL